MSTFASNSQRVPAWKRLGLKLKGPASDGSPAGNNANADQQQPNAAHVNPDARKRKNPPTNLTSGETQSPYQNGIKKFRSDGPERPGIKKSVKFSEDTKAANGDKAAKPKKAKKKKAKKVKETKEQAKPETDLGPSLAYLRQWKSSRNSWKFNKNYQILLIKYVFDGERVPSSDVGLFYEYIRDLKGLVRSRLRDTAAEIKKKDMEQGITAFPEATKDREAKQKEYEEVVAKFLQENGRDEDSTQANSSGNKRSFDEVEFVLRTATDVDLEVKQRLVKRVRAELIMEELSDSSDSTMSDAAINSIFTSSGKDGDADGAGPMDIDQDKKVVAESAGGPQPKAKRQRLKKMRSGANISDDSSSESEASDNEDDESSDIESSSDEDSDEEVQQGTAGDNAETSSSSSSSSGSDGDSDEDSDSDSGDEEGGAPIA